MCFDVSTPSHKPNSSSNFQSCRVGIIVRLRDAIFAQAKLQSINMARASPPGESAERQCDEKNRN